MSDDRSLERAARSWLQGGPTRAPGTVVEAALARIQATSQEADRHLPWSTPPFIQTAIRRARILSHPGYVRYAALGLALIAITAIGFAITGRRAEIQRPTPAPFPSAGIAQPSPTHRLTPTPRPQVPLTRNFTSTINHFVISFPDGWTVKPATKGSGHKVNVSHDDPTVDVIASPDGRIALYVVSQAIPTGMSLDTWEHTIVWLKPDTTNGCPPSDEQAHDRPLIVGGTQGTYVPYCYTLDNFTPFGNRGYLFDLYPTAAGAGSQQELADEDLFVEMLQSVVFIP